MSDMPADEFRKRRDAMRAQIEPLDRDSGNSVADRKAFFDAVYDMAGDDPAGVPWADLKPKDKLTEWLAANPGEGRTALDVACGLGDNAEALAAAGYATTAFDLSEKAVTWARQRFPESTVEYRVANALEPPESWSGGFDLVHECYTIQSVPGDLRVQLARAIAALVKPGGTLLVYTRTRAEGSTHDGPPWPLMPSESNVFSALGFTPVALDSFDIERPDRTIPHLFAVWQKR